MNKLNQAYDKSKKILVVAGASLLGLGLVVTGTAFATNRIAESKSIGAENARNFAYADAGVDPANVQLTKTEFDREFGQFVYEVDFVANDTEYDYYISATDGSVIKKEIEFRNTAANANQATNAANARSSKENLISLEQAKQVALTDAGVNESDIRFKKTELDHDDGMLVYEIEFFKDTNEYEYEINANTGDIFSRSIEKVTVREIEKDLAEAQRKQETRGANQGQEAQAGKKAESKPAKKVESNSSKSSNSSNSSSSEISAERAKEIALAHAAKHMDVSGAIFSKTKLDYDDGIKEWEIEFYVGSNEFDYEINAANGKILDWDMDHDD